MPTTRRQLNNNNIIINNNNSNNDQADTAAVVVYEALIRYLGEDPPPRLLHHTAFRTRRLFGEPEPPLLFDSLPEVIQNDYRIAATQTTISQPRSTKRSKRSNSGNATFIRTTLIDYLKNENYVLYNSLPEVIQQDRDIALATIQGSGRDVYTIDDEMSTYTGHTRHVLQYGIYHSRRQFMVLENLFQRRPEILHEEIGRFDMALLPLHSETEIPRFLQSLNTRGVDDETYHDPATALILKKEYSSVPCFEAEDYDGLLDSVKRNNGVICRFVEDVAESSFIRSMPPESLREEHCIILAMSHFWYKMDRVDANDDSDDDEGAEFDLNDIPERFTRARALCAHLLHLERNFDGTNFSLPQEHTTDRDFCLACLEAQSYRLYQDVTPHHNGTIRIWNAISEDLRSNPNFFREAVLANRHVLHYFWQSSMMKVEETPFDVLLSAIKGNGFRSVLMCSKVVDPTTFVDSFDQNLETHLGHCRGFRAFLSGTVQGRRANSSCSILSQIDTDEATGDAIKKHIASYAGVPSNVADLREVRQMRSFYQDCIDGLSGRLSLNDRMRIIS